MTTSTILLVLIPSLVAVIGVYLNHTRLSRMMKENELVKVINSKNSDIEKINLKYENLWIKFEKLNDVVKELDVAFVKLNSINFTYPFPFMLKDKNGKIVMVNDEWVRINRMTRESVIGRNDYDLFPEEKSKNFKTSDFQVINSHSGFLIEKDILDPNSLVIKWEVQGLIKEDSFIAVISVPAQTLINQCQNKI